MDAKQFQRTTRHIIRFLSFISLKKFARIQSKLLSLLGGVDKWRGQFTTSPRLAHLFAANHIADHRLR